MENIKVTPIYSDECEAVRSDHSRRAMYREPTQCEHFNVDIRVQMRLLAKERIEATRPWLFSQAAGQRQMSSH